MAYQATYRLSDILIDHIFLANHLALLTAIVTVKNVLRKSNIQIAVLNEITEMIAS